jgi:single-strand DNA-binding protein
MNNFTAIIQVKSGEMRYTPNDQKPVYDGLIELMPVYGGENPQPFAIQCSAWNKTAEIMSKYKPGTALIASGFLGMINVEQDGIKGTIARFSISEVMPTEGRLIAFNKLNILGNVGGDPEVQYFESGRNKTRLSLAVSRSKDATDWFSVELWGRPAQVAEQYVSKGSKIAITGSLKIETWTDKTTGLLRSKPIISGDRLYLVNPHQMIQFSVITLSG